MKIAHIADLHFQNRQPVLADIIKCAAFALEEIRKEAPDLILIAGDTVDFLASPEGIMIGSPAHMAAVEFVYGCGMMAPTVIVRGTPTHDGPGALDAMARLKTVYPVYVTERPEQICLTLDNVFQPWNDVVATISFAEGMFKTLISCLPTITKGNVLAYTSGSVEDTTRETQDLIRDMFHAWGVVNEQVRAEGIPTVMVGHGTLTGSRLSTGQVMTGKDLEFSLSDLALAKCDIYCFGHIHLRQEFSLPNSTARFFFSGSITRLNHGETESKGFYIHQIEDGEIDSRFIETPARVMRTLKQEGLPDVNCVQDVHEGENVRIVYQVAEADVGKVDEEAIRQEALARGAADVKIEKLIIPTVRVRAEGISKEHTLTAKLDKWAETTGQTDPEDLYDKLANLEVREVEDIIADYDSVKEDAITEVAA